MPWSNRAIQEKFQSIILKIVDFHDSFGKGKYQEQFVKIAEACMVGINSIYQETQPGAVDQIIASVCGGIRTQLKALNKIKSGKSHQSDFGDKIADIFGELSVCKGEINKFFAMEKYEDKNKFNITEINTAQTYLKTKDELVKDIQTLNDPSEIAIKRSKTCGAFFKRMASKHPKKIVGFCTTGGATVLTGALSAMDHTVGKTWDEKLEQVAPFTYKDYFAAALFIITVFVMISTFMQSRAKVPVLKDVERGNDPREPLLGDAPKYGSIQN